MEINSYKFQTPYPQQVQVGQAESKKYIAPPELEQKKEAAVAYAGYQSKKDQAEMYVKSSSLYQADDATSNSVKMYMDFSKDVQKSANMNTYLSNQKGLFN